MQQITRECTWVWSNYSDLTRPHLKWWWKVREISLFPENLAWWNIIIWPDECTHWNHTSVCRHLSTRHVWCGEDCPKTGRPTVAGRPIPSPLQVPWVVVWCECLCRLVGWYPSKELTYPIKNHFWVDDFSFYINPSWRATGFFLSILPMSFRKSLVRNPEGKRFFRWQYLKSMIVLRGSGYLVTDYM